jgi:hypothetical protein
MTLRVAITRGVNPAIARREHSHVERGSAEAA